MFRNTKLVPACSIDGNTPPFLLFWLFNLHLISASYPSWISHLHVPVIIPRLYIFQPCKLSTAGWRNWIHSTGSYRLNVPLYVLEIYTLNDLCGVTELLYVHACINWYVHMHVPVCNCMCMREYLWVCVCVCVCTCSYCMHVCVCVPPRLLKTIHVKWNLNNQLNVLAMCSYCFSLSLSWYTPSKKLFFTL